MLLMKLFSIACCEGVLSQSALQQLRSRNQRRPEQGKQEEPKTEHKAISAEVSECRLLSEGKVCYYGRSL